jgi:23S rRNA pseudouridine955/2504/2580 synthase
MNQFNPVSTYEVTEDYQGVRLDNCLISLMKGLPRSKIYSIIRKGEVRINSSRSKPSQKLNLGDKIRIPPYTHDSKPSKKAASNLMEKLVSRLVVVDKKFLIFDKPIGLASHGGSGISMGLIETVRQMDPRYKEAQLVHRLDKDTSGCIVIALRKSILREFHKEIRENKVLKKYIAVVKGSWPISLNKVELNISKDRLRSGEREVQVNKDGKNSISKFKLLKSNKKLSLIECQIITGRTHQIRVHTTHSGHPIAGDVKYGDELFNKSLKPQLNRMLLHSSHINFKNLGIEATSETPKLFEDLLK